MTCTLTLCWHNCSFINKESVKLKEKSMLVLNLRTTAMPHYLTTILIVSDTCLLSRPIGCPVQWNILEKQYDGSANRSSRVTITNKAVNSCPWNNPPTRSFIRLTGCLVWNPLLHGEEKTRVLQTEPVGCACYLLTGELGTRIVDEIFAIWAPNFPR